MISPRMRMLVFLSVLLRVASLNNVGTFLSVASNHVSRVESLSVSSDVNSTEISENIVISNRWGISKISAPILLRLKSISIQEMLFCIPILIIPVMILTILSGTTQFISLGIYHVVLTSSLFAMSIYRWTNIRKHNAVEI